MILKIDNAFKYPAHLLFQYSNSSGVRSFLSGMWHVNTYGLFLTHVWRPNTVLILAKYIGLIRNNTLLFSYARGFNKVIVCLNLGNYLSEFLEVLRNMIMILKLGWSGFVSEFDLLLNMKKLVVLVVLMYFPWTLCAWTVF